MRDSDICPFCYEEKQHWRALGLWYACSDCANNHDAYINLMNGDIEPWDMGDG